MRMEIAIIGLFQAAVVAVIGGLFARDSKSRKRQLDDADVRASLRAEESRLSMKLISADMSLTMATARAVRDGKTNGEMSGALEVAERAQHDYYGFVNAIAAKHITK